MDGLTVAHLLDHIEALAPKVLAMDYDNVGLLIGDKALTVSGIILGLELTEALIDEAIEKQCNVILVHHPLIFKPLYSIQASTPLGSKIYRLIRHNISVIAAHTNLDMARHGLNDFVLEKLGIEPEESVSDNIRCGHIRKQTLEEFIYFIKRTLELEYIHYCGDLTKEVVKVGLCTGSGMSFYKEALGENVDVYITGDMKYHDAVDAVETGIPIIDATHFGTEIWVEELLYTYLFGKLGGQCPIYQFKHYQNPIKVLI